MVDRPASPRILWVTEEPPDRALGGGSIRQAHLFTALGASFTTDLLTIGRVQDEPVRAAAAGITELPRRWPRNASGPLGRRVQDLAILLGSRYPTALYPAASARQALAAELSARAHRYDMVCVEHETLAPLANRARASRWMITLHNRLSGMIAADLAGAPGRRQRWFRARDLDKAERLERWITRTYDRCLVCSEQDAAALAALAEVPGERLAVIPNGVDLSVFSVTPVPREPRVLLPARLAYGPNVDGAVWFCTTVWPAIRAAVPAASLVLAGRSPLPEVLALERLPGVTVRADVPSMVPYFEAARVVVVPIRIGTGTRLKALEGMAAGRPVVGTTVGLEGIDVKHGGQALVADEPEPMAAAVVEVLRRDDLARDLARAGRRHVEGGYGWDRIGSRFVKAVRETLAGGRADSPGQEHRVVPFRG